jgi:hypothetical protein
MTLMDSEKQFRLSFLESTYRHSLQTLLRDSIPWQLTFSDIALHCFHVSPPPLDRVVHVTSHSLKTHFNIILLSTHRSPLKFSYQNSLCISYLSRAFYIPHLHITSNVLQTNITSQRYARVCSGRLRTCIYFTALMMGLLHLTRLQSDRTGDFYTFIHS